jgi:predicted amino acid racemase
MMTAPRLDINLDKIGHNARTLVERLGKRGISVTGVTKASLGNAEIAATLLEAGVKRLADSRIENIEALEATFGLTVEIVSGGNSANLEWALSGAATPPQHTSFQTPPTEAQARNSGLTRACRAG